MISLLCFILGTVFGFGTALAFFMGALIDKSSNPVDNLTSRIERVAKGMNSQKGSIIYPKTEDLIAMEETFARNDREGKDTLIGEIEAREQV